VNLTAKILAAPAPAAEPMSVSAIAEHLGFARSASGQRPSGQARELLDAMLHDALREVYAEAEKRFGADSAEASAVMLRLLAKDPNARPPVWLVEAMRPHTKALASIFAS
jgi:hypothetical protein